jgi:hypothetical protein
MGHSLEYLAKIGAQGGKTTLKRKGSSFFREISKMRKRFAGGRPRKIKLIHATAPELESKITSGNIKLKDAVKVAKAWKPKQKKFFYLDEAVAQCMGGLSRRLNAVPQEYSEEFRKEISKAIDSWLTANGCRG